MDKWIVSILARLWNFWNLLNSPNSHIFLPMIVVVINSFPTNTESSKPAQCMKTNYHVINEDDRMWSYESSSDVLKDHAKSRLCNDDSTFVQNKWVRFISDNDHKRIQLAENCPSMTNEEITSSNKTFCQALYRGWVQGKHPSALEGLFIPPTHWHALMLLHHDTNKIYFVFFSF